MKRTEVVSHERLQLHRLADRPALARAMAACFGSAVESGVQTRGVASVALAGGGTPRAYFPALAALPLPWDRVELTLSDERWVGPDHPHSNEAVVRRHLMVGPAARARLTPLYVAAGSVEDTASERHAAVRALPHPYDLMMLGFGADAHIASLFAGAAQFAQAIAPATTAACIAVHPPPEVEPAVARISLTLNEILDSRRIVIAATGADKQAALHATLQAAADGPNRSSPLPQLLARARCPVEFFWAP